MSNTWSGKDGEKDRGVGLIEVIVAVVLLGVLASAVLAIVLQAQAATVNNRSRVAASNLAAREIDYVREQFMATENGPLDLATAGTVVNPHSFGAAGTPLVVDGQPYTVKRSVAWNVSGSGSSACEGGSLVRYPTMNIRVEVTWPDMGQTHPVVNTANLAPPKGTGLSTTSSFIAVKVTDSAGKANPGRSVTVYSTGSGAETRSGTTDDSGCAVIEVHPQSGSGTSYNARLSDAGHVDMSGNPTPERLVGTVARGVLNSSIDMSYDRAAAVEITITGGGVIDSDVAGSQVNLYQSQSTGGGAVTAHNLTGVRTIIKGLWPTEYSAYLGPIPPASYTTIAIGPGATGRLDVPITLADFVVTGHPGGASILAAPAGATSCVSAGARPVDPAAGGLIPGQWTFFATAPSIGCSPGPSAVPLVEGSNTDVVWKPSTLSVVGAPPGPLWAVSSATASAACTPPSVPGGAVLLGDGSSAAVPLPAGDWYVFVTASAGTEPAPGQPCASSGLVSVPYGTDKTFTWVTAPGGRP